MICQQCIDLELSPSTVEQIGFPRTSHEQVATSFNDKGEPTAFELQRKIKTNYKCSNEHTFQEIE